MPPPTFCMLGLAGAMAADMGQSVTALPASSPPVHLALSASSASGGARCSRLEDLMRTVTLPARVPFTAALPIALPAHACPRCKAGAVCLACGLREGKLHLLDSAAFPAHRLRAGEPVYHQGQKFTHLYLVRSGTIKTTIGLRDGREQVSGFHMGCHILGLEDMAIGVHASRRSRSRIRRPASSNRRTSPLWRPSLAGFGLLATSSAFHCATEAR